MLVIGVDEAGYGPLLGPLVVAAAAFRVEGDEEPRTFASTFRDALRRAGRLRVGDSKRIFGPARELASLERPVLAFSTLTDEADCLDTLLRRLGVDPTHRRTVPWYTGDPPAFPCAVTANDVRRAAESLSARLAEAGIEFVGFAADVVVESRFNASLREGNKAEVLFEVTYRVQERLRTLRRPGESVATVFDRHGGRHAYAAHLQRRRTEDLVMVLRESSEVSDYHVRSGLGPESVRFEVEADAAHPHVGLASMVAKYLREVHMGLFNAHFARICPGVAPTAGYHGDGRRWLVQSRPAREAAGIPDSDLVRLR